MRCPACASTKLRIGVVFTGEVACEFRNGSVVEILEGSTLQSAWDDESRCSCLTCNWSGFVHDLRSLEDLVPDRKLSDRKLSESELLGMERDLLLGKCPKRLERRVGKVVDAVRKLQTQLQILETLDRAKNKGRRIKQSDTAIL
jgi:hypothetical protein